MNTIFLYVSLDLIFTLTQVSTFADMEGEETFEPSFLGYADEVVEERISDDAVVMIKGTKTTSAVSLRLTCRLFSSFSMKE